MSWVAGISRIVRLWISVVWGFNRVILTKLLQVQHVFRPSADGEARGAPFRRRRVAGIHEDSGGLTPTYGTLMFPANLQRPYYIRNEAFWQKAHRCQPRGRERLTSRQLMLLTYASLPCSSWPVVPTRRAGPGALNDTRCPCIPQGWHKGYTG